MICEKATLPQDNSFQMIPPSVQPLRLWTPRVSSTAVAAEIRWKKPQGKMTVPAFTIKGGFMNGADGERRMVIAGRIFRHRES